MGEVPIAALSFFGVNAQGVVLIAVVNTTAQKDQVDDIHA